MKTLLPQRVVRYLDFVWRQYFPPVDNKATNTALGLCDSLPESLAGARSFSSLCKLEMPTFLFTHADSLIINQPCNYTVAYKEQGEGEDRAGEDAAEIGRVGIKVVVEPIVW